MGVSLRCYKHNLEFGEFSECPSCTLEKALGGIAFAGCREPHVTEELRDLINQMAVALRCYANFGYITPVNSSPKELAAQAFDLLERL